MKVQQFEDKYLAQFSYAVLSECTRKVVLIDPARDPRPYFRFAEDHGADILAVIETHPHADFVSSHLEIHEKTGAPIYGSKLMEASFPITCFDEGDVLSFGKIRLKALSTPGHSPDSISVVLEHEGKDKAVFTGDTLFIGDCGRPDLRESSGDQEALREKLARKMYSSLRDKLMLLDDDVRLYPAHGAGTLCGKALSDAKSSTIGAEKLSNWSLQQMPEEQFVQELISNQPFIPGYFPFDVELNKKGASWFERGTADVPISLASNLEKGLWIVDVRDQRDFKNGHLAHSVNIMDGDKFETWLGSIIKPQESFYLAAGSKDQLRRMIERAASIGYETQIKQGFVLRYGGQKDLGFDLAKFREHPGEYTIVDVRNPSEAQEKPIFRTSLNIPLGELRDRMQELSTEKPIAVHCAGGYRSAAASSLISSKLGHRVHVFDMSEAIKSFE